MILSLPIIFDTIDTITLPSGRSFELKQGRYDAGRWVGDPLASTTMEVFCSGKRVALLFDGYVYGWGNIHGSLSPCRGCGVGLQDHDQNQHDTSPMPDLRKAFELVCFRADYILTARERNRSVA